MVQRQVAWSVRFRGRKGFSKLQHAISFTVFYGKRSVFTSSFSLRHKRVTDRRRYLENLVNRLERERKKIVASRKKPRPKAKPKPRSKAKLKAKSKPKVIPKPTKKELSESQRVLLHEEDYAQAGLPIFEKAYCEPSPYFKNVDILDTTIIPVRPESPDWKKRTVEKLLITSLEGKYQLSILDFDMNENKYFVLEEDSADVAYREIFATFWPHIRQYFLDTKNSTSGYILRFKFLWEGDGERVKPFMKHGISVTRNEIRSVHGMIDLFKKTWARFGGPTEQEIIRGKKGQRRYLVGDRLILITGFTLESVLF